MTVFLKDVLGLKLEFEADVTAEFSTEQGDRIQVFGPGHEYFDRFSAYGTDWLTVLTAVDDPKYLSQQYLTSTHFKREPDASKWAPSPCEN